MATERYVITTVECPRCKTKQKVHVAVRAVATQMADEAILCINCDHRFNVPLPDKILRGPFPA
jgi:transcription elongation factor Elf1